MVRVARHGAERGLLSSNMAPPSLAEVTIVWTQSGL